MTPPLSSAGMNAGHERIPGANHPKLDTASRKRMLPLRARHRAFSRGPGSRLPGSSSAMDKSDPSSRLTKRIACPRSDRFRFGPRFDGLPHDCYDHPAGWSSLVARWAHNPKVGGSNPPPATKGIISLREFGLNRETPKNPQ